MKGAASRPARNLGAAAKKRTSTKSVDEPTSSRAPVLVIGSGLHVAAGTGALDWPALVGVVFGQQRTRRKHDEAVALAWEARLVDQVSKNCQYQPFTAERTALRKLALALDEQYPAAVESKIHDRLRAGGIADLVVFNFDRSLHQDLDGAAWRDERRAPDLPGTRVWHPHGHTGAPRSIVFGTRRYGTEVAKLEAARKAYWQAFRGDDARGVVDPTPTHWLHTLLSRREVHLIGLGLRPEEWTLWWALTQRARRFARDAGRGAPKTVAHVFHNRSKADAHSMWRTSALASLRIEERRFGPGKSTAVWKEVIDQCQPARNEGSS